MDAHWLVPHFEKMLYDNALLARAYLHGWQVTGEPLFRGVCEETLDWALREMRGDEGGFYSALDADSEGEEGKFYVWSLAELREAGGDEAVEAFGATEGGNFEGKEHPGPRRRGIARAEAPPVRGPLAARMARARRQAADLLERAHDRRAGRGGRRARAARTTSTPRAAAAGFILSELRDEGGRLLRTWKDGQAKLNAYLEDHAFLLEALLTLYEATFEPRWFAEARALADTMIERFADEDHGGFFETSSDHEQLVARRKDLEDHPIPSGNASAAYGLLRLAALTGEHDYEKRAVGVFRLLHTVAARHPQAFAHLLQALDFHFAPVKEVALVGPDREPLERTVRSRFRPHLVLAGGEPDGVPLLEGREPVDGRAAAYVCEHFACQRPVTEPDELEALLA